MKIYGIGRLTRDVEIRYSQGAEPQAFATFGIAAERKFKREGEPEADFFDCVAFGGKAEFIAKYFGQGSKVFLEGEIRNDNYTNKEGAKIYRNRIYVSEIEFADSKPQNDGSVQNAPASQTQTAAVSQAPAAKQRTASGSRRTAAAKPAAPADDGFMNIPDGIGDELPFLN